MRTLWFTISLLLSVAAGYFGYGLLPSLIDSMTTGILPSSYIYLLKNNFFIMLSGQIAIGILAMVLLGFVLPALIDGIMIWQARQRIAAFPEKSRAKSRSLIAEFMAIFNNIPLLLDNARGYAEYLEELPQAASGTKTQGREDLPRLHTRVAAQGFFPITRMVDRPLRSWLFTQLPALLLAIGLVICLIATLLGVHDYKEVLPMDPVGSSSILWTRLEIGIFALTLAAVGSLLCAAINRVVLGLRRGQAADFCDALDLKFSFTPPTVVLDEILRSQQEQGKAGSMALEKMSGEVTLVLKSGQKDLGDSFAKTSDALAIKLAKAIDTSLHAPMETLTAATVKLTAEQADMVSGLVKSSLAAFVENLEKHAGDQIRESNNVMKSTATLASKIERSFTDASKNVVKAGKEQSDSIANVSKELNKTLTMFKGLEQGLEKSVKALQPMMDQAIENQKALLSALDDESASSKTIGQAASEMTAAAKASKDTVESFIVLAERMRDAAKALSGAQASGLKKTSDSDRLTNAFRELKSQMEDISKLPKL